MTVLESIDSHADLEIGWRNGKGGPLSARVIKAGKQLVYGILGDGNAEENIEDFPLEDGRLLINYYSEVDYQFLLSTDGLIRLTIDREGKLSKIGDRLTVQLALRIFAWRTICHTSTIFTSEISAKTRNTLEAELLSPMNSVIYPLYWQNALGNAQAIPASMEEIFTPRLPETPFSSSRRRSQNYRSTPGSNRKRPSLATNVTSILKDVCRNKLGELPTGSQGIDWRGYPSVTGGPILPFLMKFSVDSEMISISENDNVLQTSAAPVE